MIYLDSAATSLWHPKEAEERMIQALRGCGNAGRGAHDATLDAGRIVFETRMRLAELFHAESPERIAFTCNDTEALNTAIFGLFGPGDHVITTVCEHNSVLRPLYALEKQGLELSVIPADVSGRIDYDQMEAAVRKNTKAFVVTHASNLTGNITDLARVCEIAEHHSLLLIVDAAQGIEAQTLANCYLAVDHNLEIMPVINKIDLPSADPDRVVAEIEDVIGIEAHDAPRISAKNGTNIEEVLEQIVTKIPAPQGDADAPLKALIFDSLYDAYKGVIIFCRVFDGTVKKGTNIRMMATEAEAEVVQVGIFGAGQFIPCDELSAGMVGYITASLKNVKDTTVGDTVTDADNPCAEALPGYKKVNPMVYCGLYPADGAKYPDLRDALEKLQLNDASLSYEPETSIALGFGFRCGFLGLLHLEIIQERLEREYNLDLVTTAPGVIYRVHKTDGEVMELTNPSNLPDPSTIEYMEEPFVSAEIMVTTEYVGAIMQLCQERRGVYKSMEYMETTRALLKYDLPLNEIIYDFFDALKSRSRGYASFDYEMKGYVRSDLVKLDILINKEEVDALSFILHKDTAYERGRKMCEKLKEEIPRQLFEIPIQAAIGSKVIARETVKAMRKDVLAKCYGGDISRKRKLLEKQKEGKKRMRQVGNVEIPQKAFMSVLKLDEE